MRRLALLLVLLSLAGCAERWSRPGTSEAEADATNSACTDQSALAIPPRYEWRIVEQARLERDRQCWRGRDGREICHVTERWRPPRWGQVDVNSGMRAAWRRQCMTTQGFVFEGYRPLRLE